MSPRIRDLASARRLLTSCGISAESSHDRELLARAEALLRAVHDWEGREREGETGEDLGLASLTATWDRHTDATFTQQDLPATMATMTLHPYVVHIPTNTGGYGRIEVERFYRDHFLTKLPKDAALHRISRTADADQVVDELILTFTHDREIDFLLPGVPATGRHVELPHVVVVGFEDGKIHHEHVYWDQASLLVQVGRLDSTQLPVLGVESARKLRNPALPSNELIGRRYHS